MTLKHMFCVIALALATTTPALADGMVDGPHGGGWARGGHGYGHGRRGPRHHAVRHRGHAGGWGYGGHGGGYGGGHFYAGAGAGAPFGPAVVAEYREPYIGKGLIYNVPPDPWAYMSGVISAKY